LSAHPPKNDLIAFIVLVDYEEKRTERKRERIQLHITAELTWAQRNGNIITYLVAF
jgi:hypothetical protein